MPIYEFMCNECNIKFEKHYSSYYKNEIEECPNCKKPAQKLISLANFKFAEPTSIPKEIDMKIGADSEKRWLEYEDRKNSKEKIRKESGEHALSRDFEGNYTPLAVSKDDQVLSKDEGLKVREDIIKEYTKIVSDPSTEKTVGPE